VPPQACEPPSRIERRRLVAHMSRVVREKPKFLDDGIHFPTLCGYCNNTRLGNWYDPALATFTKAVARAVYATSSRTLVLPEVIAVDARPQRVARSVIGHLLAAECPPIEHLDMPGGDPNLLRHLQSTVRDFHDAMRGYFMDKDAPLPERVSIVYWLYQSPTVVVAPWVTKIKMAPGSHLRFYLTWLAVSASYERTTQIA